MEAAELAQALVRALPPGGEVRDLVRLTGGATRTSWAFDWHVGDARQPLVLQQAPRAEPTRGIGPVKLSAEDDAAVMTVARRHGVPAPRVVRVLQPADGLGAGVISRRIDGETRAPTLVRDPRYAPARALLARQCGTALAAIHRIPTDDLSFLRTLSPADELAVYGALVEAEAQVTPALAYALRWIAKHLPEHWRRTGVHGDFRSGNLVVGADDGLRGVLDWEIARIGDPMQDLGVLCMRSWRFGGAGEVGGFGARDALYAAYEAAGGAPVDPERVRFWEAFANLKWAISCVRRGRAVHADGRPASLELAVVGRRLAEPLWDFFELTASPADAIPPPVAAEDASASSAASPSTATLLRTVDAYLDTELLPTLDGYHRFQTRVALNALCIVQREAALGPASRAREQVGLEALLDRRGDAATLNRVLCDGIATGRLPLDAPGLRDHLRRTLRDTLAIDSPHWIKGPPEA